MNSVLIDAGILVCAVIFLIAVNEWRATRGKRDAIDVDLTGSKPRPRKR